MHKVNLKLAYELCRKQTGEGIWDAFRLRPGGSALWTTTTALTALGKVVLVNERKRQPNWLIKSIERGWEYLDKNCQNKSIGFNQETPSDADSTTWLCRALIMRYQLFRAGVLRGSFGDSEVLGWLLKGLDYIREHVDSSCMGVRTYTEEDNILEYIDFNGQKSSWLSKHNCVTANTRMLGLELGEIPIHSLDKYSLVFLGLETDRNAFWWTDSRVIDLIYGEITSADFPLVLRVPEHSDQSGSNTVYHESTDTEGALSIDDGSFVLSLTILASCNSGKTWKQD